MFSLSACKSVGGSTVHFNFQITPQKKRIELLGPAKEEAMAHHRNEKSPAAETNGETQRCYSQPCRP